LGLLNAIDSQNEAAMNKSAFWDSYLSIDSDKEIGMEAWCLCEAAFASHKENISKLIKSLNPSSIAVLGSGYLNDIPLYDLIEENRKVYLVDWIDNISKVGVSKNIICRPDDNRIECLLCSESTGKRYCKNYTGEVLRDRVCTGYESVKEPFDTCKNYDPATDPYFIKADITGGVARSFSEKIEEMIGTCNTVKQAFIKAGAIAERLKYRSMEMESDSIELVTSSMILSQFDVEPYTFFASLLENKFGRAEILKHESKLLPLMEKLRTRLFISQVESHIKEMYRILIKDGRSRAYLSAELFRSFSDGKRFFLVQDMSKALEIIGKYFFYEFDDDVGISTLKKSKLGDGISVNQSYVLTPKYEKHL
jgi:hypothetical protein